jgi:hypothetical protein
VKLRTEVTQQSPDLAGRTEEQRGNHHTDPSVQNHECWQHPSTLPLALPLPACARPRSSDLPPVSVISQVGIKEQTQEDNENRVTEVIPVY